MSNLRLITMMWLGLGLCCGLAGAGDEPQPAADPYNLDPGERSAEIIRVPPLELTESESAWLTEDLFAQQQKAASRRAIWLVDDFEDGDLVDWINPLFPSTTCAAMSTAPGADLSSRSMRIDGACGHYHGRYYSLGGFRATSVSLFVRSPSTATNDTYFVIGDDNVAVNNGVVFFFASNSGQFEVYSNGISYSCGTYIAYQWYEISFTIDWECQVFDVYVDWVLRQQDIPFRSLTTTTLTRLHAYNYDNTSGWWDEIIMSSPPASMLIFRDEFERGGLCHWDSATN